MNAAILCPGPSLSRFQDRSGYDLVIGVNRSAVAHAVDVWCCGDWPLYQRVQQDVIGSPLWFTDPNSAGYVGVHGPAWRGKLTTFDQIDPHIENDWKIYSLYAAVGYAVVAGATRIEVYGADWNGEKDFDGTLAGNTRDENRWRVEASGFRALVEILGRRGIELSRKMRPLYIGYFTVRTPYEQEAASLIKSLDAFGLEHDIVPIESLGSWQKNTQYKSRFVLSMFEAHPNRPLVYIDVDAVVKRQPVMFDTLQCDIAAVRFLRAELLGGTVYFAGNDCSLAVVQAWCRLCERYPDQLPDGSDAWDQRLLDMALTETKDARFEELPPVYTWIEDLSAQYFQGDPVILHTRASQKYKKVVNE